MKLFVVVFAITLAYTESRVASSGKLRNLLNELKSDVAEIKKSLHDNEEGKNANPPPEIQYHKKPSQPPMIFDSSYELQEASSEFQNDNDPPMIFDEQSEDEMSLSPVDEADPVKTGMTEVEINQKNGYFGDEMKFDPEIAKRGVATRATLWIENGNLNIPYVIDSALTGGHKTAIDNAIKAMNDVLGPCTGDLWYERKNEPHYVRFIKDSGCWSYVGKITKSPQEISIGVGCQYEGIVLHEMLHAMGFSHEQSRSDRDEFVTINLNNIASGMERNFDKVASMRAASVNSPYDYGSVMHYNGYAFSKNGKPTIEAKGTGVTLGQRFGLSDIDKKELLDIYQCQAATTTAPITKKPTETTEEPTETTEKPTKTTEEPTETTEEPTETTEKPTKTTEEPTETTEEPTETTEKPTKTTEEPTETTEEPTETTEEPTETTEEPTEIIGSLAISKVITRGFKRIYDDGCTPKNKRNGRGCEKSTLLSVQADPNTRWRILREHLSTKTMCKGSSDIKYFCAHLRFERDNIQSPRPVLYRRRPKVSQLEGDLRVTVYFPCKYSAYHQHARMVARARNVNWNVSSGLTITEFALENGKCVAAGK